MTFCIEYPPRAREHDHRRLRELGAKSMGGRGSGNYDALRDTINHRLTAHDAWLEQKIAEAKLAPDFTYREKDNG